MELFSSLEAEIILPGLSHDNIVTCLERKVSLPFSLLLKHLISLLVNMVSFMFIYATTFALYSSEEIQAHLLITMNKQAHGSFVDLWSRDDDASADPRYISTTYIDWDKISNRTSIQKEHTGKHMQQSCSLHMFMSVGQLPLLRASV
ncbi:hypothetical protein M5689_020766 [Euphorbia peplus]|nr:hypothetical protein M5689_020766 [Euphorbia peplus]